jgi:hypothetical protein
MAAESTAAYLNYHRRTERASKGAQAAAATATPIADMSATHFAVVKCNKHTADHRRDPPQPSAVAGLATTISKSNDLEHPDEGGRTVACKRSSPVRINIPEVRFY